MSDVAGARAVRDEDAFDVPTMAEWLRGHAADAGQDAGGLDGIPTVRQFTGGASNLTYLLTYAASPAFPRGRELILRRPPAGTKARGAHDMAREYHLQAALAPVFPKVPPMVALCQDEGVLGSDFYVMQRLAGTIPRKDLPASLGLDAAGVERLCVNALDTLVELHSVALDGSGLEHLDKGPGYVERQVSGWSSRYRRARTRDVGSFEKVIAWLAEHQPEELPHVLIHNDFRFDNLVLADAPDPLGTGAHLAPDPTGIRGVLDWEMATVGDPLMDLGGAMAYWVQADDDPVRRRMRLQPTHTPGMLTRVQAVRYYCAARGIEMDRTRWTFYEVFGLFRLAAIAQQIYYRYHEGQTTNPAYARFRWMVIYLEYRCRRLIRGV